MVGCKRVKVFRGGHFENPGLPGWCLRFVIVEMSRTRLERQETL